MAARPQTKLLVPVRGRPTQPTSPDRGHQTPVGGGLRPLRSKPRYGARIAAISVTGSLMMLTSSQGWASPPGGYDAPNYVSYQRPATERRGGFTVGMNLGFGLGSANAYPNEADKIGDSAFQESTGVGFNQQFSLWLGGTLRDWLTVGFGFSLAATRGSGLVGANAGPIFKVEGFPLYAQGGLWKDLGFSLDAGLGVGSITDPNNPNEILAGGGATSQLGLTLFYEPFRFWAASSGPSITYAQGFGQIYSQQQLIFGWRFVIYSGQPKKKARSPTAATPEAPAAHGAQTNQAHQERTK